MATGQGRQSTVGHKYLIRLVSVRGNSTTKGYQVRIRTADARCTKYFSDTKCGSRKDALIAAIRFRNKFCNQNNIQYK